MSLFGALNIGSSALATSQASLQVTGNNIANAGNADYTRQTASITEAPDQQLRPGQFVGSGVNLTGIQRQIDDALESRIRASTSDTSAADASQQWLSRVEATFNAVGDTNLSTSMSAYFKSWSDLANKPQDAGLRQVVIQNGAGLASQFADVRQQLVGLQGDASSQLKTQVQSADALATQVASLNSQIVTAEAGTGGTANSLRDQRDATLKQLSQLLDVKTVQQPGGTIDVYVGSEPLVVGAKSNGLTLRQPSADGPAQPQVIFKSNSGPVPITSGEIGALTMLGSQVGAVVGQVDTLAHNLISEVNKLHSAGQGLEGFDSVQSTNAVDDPAAALGSSAANLAFPPTSGSFVVHVTQKSTGAVTSTLVQVDPKTTTLNSLRAALAGIDGVTASVSGGKLQISAASSAVGLSFSQDSSGALASLGIGSFFSGTDASDIAVNSAVVAQPSLLAAAKNGDKGDNQTALAIAALESSPLKGLDGSSLQDTYQSIVNGVSTQTANAKVNAESAQVVSDTLDSQRQALSGVSLDEEAINLVRQQRAFQGAAKYITTVNELMQSLLDIAK